MTTDRRPLPALALMLTYLPALAVLGVSLVLHEAKGVDFGLVSRDPSAQFNAYPLVGAQSMLGGLAWISAAVVAFVTVGVLRRTGKGRQERTRFLLGMGGFTLVMGVDDIFLLHDGLGPEYLGIDERPFLLAYGVLIVAIVVRFRRTILRLEPVLLGLAVLLLTASIGVDHFQEQLDGSPYRIFFEDGFKFLGIVGWGGYVIRECWLVLAAEVTLAVAPTGRRAARVAMLSGSQLPHAVQEPLPGAPSTSSPVHPGFPPPAGRATRSIAWGGGHAR